MPKRQLKDPCTKLCKDIALAEKQYTIFIDDPSQTLMVEPDFTSPPVKHDVESYKNGSKKFKLIVDEEEFDIYELKDEIMNVYKTYFHIK